MTRRNIQKRAQLLGIKRSSPQAQDSCLSAFIERPCKMMTAYSLSMATWRRAKISKDSERQFAEYLLAIPVDGQRRSRRDMISLMKKAREQGAKKK